ncbi:MAG: TonB-dependent receptor, partial [Candidatus Omnitrophica bacterium]|nr:TonB-dependent receptor [Candidatus Omnitrophota bacterium]
DSLMYSLKGHWKVWEGFYVRSALSSHIRLPSFTELYYGDPTTWGNPGLSPERSFDYEAGFDHRQGASSCGVTFFVRKEKNIIDWVKSGPVEALWEARNIDRGTTRGIEAYARQELRDTVSLEETYTFAQRNLEDDGYLYKYGVNYARHQGAVRVIVRALGGAQAIGIRYKKKPARDGWVLLDAKFEYPFGKAAVFLSFENLLGTEYQEIEGVAEPARYAECGMRFTW